MSWASRTSARWRCARSRRDRSRVTVRPATSGAEHCGRTAVPKRRRTSRPRARPLHAGPSSTALRASASRVRRHPAHRRCGGASCDNEDTEQPQTASSVDVVEQRTAVASTPVRGRCGRQRPRAGDRRRSRRTRIFTVTTRPATSADAVARPRGRERDQLAVELRSGTDASQRSLRRRSTSSRGSFRSAGRRCSGTARGDRPWTTPSVASSVRRAAPPLRRSCARRSARAWRASSDHAPELCTGSGARNSSSPADPMSTPSGFGHIARDLRQELRARTAHADRQAGLVADARRRISAATRSVAVQPLDRRHVEKRLVHRELLDVGRDVAQDRHHAPAVLLVHAVPRRHVHAVRALPARDSRGHRRVHPEGARLVARRGHHAAPAEPGDDHRLAAQRRIEELFDRREEGVEVDVEDHAPLPPLGCARAPRAHRRSTRRSLRLVPNTS